MNEHIMGPQHLTVPTYGLVLRMCTGKLPSESRRFSSRALFESKGKTEQASRRECGIHTYSRDAKPLRVEDTELVYTIAVHGQVTSNNTT